MTVDLSHVCEYSAQGVSQTASLHDILASHPMTIMYFYPKDDTPGCTIEAKDFALTYENLRTRGIGLYGVSKDSHRSHCKFQEKYDLPFPLISDPDFVLHGMVDAVGQKSMYGKSYTGTIRSTFLFDNAGTLLHSWKNVSASGHVAEVMDKIASLQ